MPGSSPSSACGKLLVTGLSLLAIGMLWLTRVPADADYVADLLPAFLLAGVAIGLCAPSVQIGALSGVAESTSGLASGLVETMREIGGAAGVAAVSTMLVSRAGLDGFQAAFVVICIAAARSSHRWDRFPPAGPKPRARKNSSERPLPGRKTWRPCVVPVEASNSMPDGYPDRHIGGSNGPFLSRRRYVRADR